MRKKWSDPALVGHKFGAATLVSCFMKGKSVMWNCRCDCGKMFVRYGYTFGRGQWISCGCQHPRYNKGAKSGRWRGCGELNGQYYCALRLGAKARKLPFDVSIEFLWHLFQQQEGKCALTGLPLCFQSHMDKRLGAIQTASLDRIDSNGGYVEGNVQWVHTDVNMAKQDYSEERFIELCNLVAAKHPRDVTPQSCHNTPPPEPEAAIAA